MILKDKIINKNAKDEEVKKEESLMVRLRDPRFTSDKFGNEILKPNKNKNPGIEAQNPMMNEMKGINLL